MASREPTLSEVVATLLSPECSLQKWLDSLKEDGSDKKYITVLLRVDLNVPIADGMVKDDSRLLAALPGIKALLDAGAKVVLASHLGRPQPKTQTHEQMLAQFSLAPVAKLLASHLGDCFKGLAGDCIGPQVAAQVSDLQPKEALLLENTRFHLGDTGNSEQFSAELASLCDVFVCDAFGVMHRDQGSVTGVTKFVKHCFPGPLVVHELTHLGLHLDEPKRPLGVLIGGAKVSDKIGVISSLIKKADVVIIGGRMAFTFLAAKGVWVGATQVEHAWLKPALEMIAAAKERGVKLLLPSDVIISHSLSEPDRLTLQQLTTTCCTEDQPCIPPDCYGVDIGPKSSKAFAEALLSCNTLFWNGPMGIFEIPEFAEGTNAIARAMAEATTKNQAITIIGGGDSVSAVNSLGLTSSISHISTGGGASLELLEGKGMPGLRALAAAHLKHES